MLYQLSYASPNGLGQRALKPETVCDEPFCSIPTSANARADDACAKVRRKSNFSIGGYGGQRGSIAAD